MWWLGGHILLATCCIYIYSVLGESSYSVQSPQALVLTGCDVAMTQGLAACYCLCPHTDTRPQGTLLHWWGFRSLLDLGFDPCATGGSRSLTPTPFRANTLIQNVSLGIEVSQMTSSSGAAFRLLVYKIYSRHQLFFFQLMHCICKNMSYLSVSNLSCTGIVKDF